MSDIGGGAGETPALAVNPLLDALRPRATGNLLVIFHEGVSAATQQSLIQRAFPAGNLDLRAGAAAFARPAPSARLGAGAPHARVFDRLGIAVVAPGGGMTASALGATMADFDEIKEQRPEFYLYALAAAAAFADTSDATWGLAATGVRSSPYTGKGIKLAVLDTGLDLSHPDFAGRTIVSQSFVDGQGVGDVFGHGTHCAGTAAGPRAKGTTAPGYGCAPDAELYIGKVLDDGGHAEEGTIAAGMSWAIDEGCQVISMSLGRPVQPGEPPTDYYERLGKSALDAGALMIAAAGNESARISGFISPVDEPANSPSIMAVGALDATLAVAYFSNGGINPNGGAVDIAAPGVSVFSSYPVPQTYKILSGTSMACPHVAGIAALWAESDPSLRGPALWKALTDSARALPLPARDVGAGLVQAPPAKAAGA